MEFLKDWVDFILHFDQHLAVMIDKFGIWTYVVLFLIVFCETGLVVMPFLPGDSLLFAAGAIAALMPDKINIFVLLISLIIAAIMGDTMNYWIGRYFSNVGSLGKIPFVKEKHLEKTREYFEKYGGKTIIIARFIPFIRTFAPFVAGLGKMNYGYFLFYNVVGGVVWIGFFLMLGYGFGNISIVKQNFKVVVLAIIALSVLPVMYELWMHQLKSRKGKQGIDEAVDKADDSLL